MGLLDKIYRHLAKKSNQDSRVYEKIGSTLGKYMIPFLHKDKKITKNILVANFYLVLSKVCFFGGPLCLKKGINALQMGVMTDPTLMFFGYGICYTGSIFFESLRNIKNNELSNAAVKDLSEQAYGHMLNLDPQFFFGSSQRQKLFKLNRALQAIEQNLRTLNQFLFPMFVDVVVSSILIFKYFGSLYVGTFLATFVMYSVFTIKYSDYRRAGVRKQRTAEKDVDFLMSETFSNYYNVKYYSAQEFQRQRYVRKLEDNYQNNIHNQKTLGVLNTVQRLFFASGMTINMIMAGWQAKSNLLSAGDIVMMQSLMLQLINPLFFLGTMYRNFTQSFLDIRQLYKVLLTEPKIKDLPDALPSGQLAGRIQMRNVNFKYESQPNLILKNVNFVIEPGQFVSIMGASGIGKSTLFKLIFRLYDPESGQVFLDGKDVKTMKLNDFRKQICLVSQTPYLFNDTVMNNILYNTTKASADDVKKLAAELGLHDVIMQLPHGYDTPVGQRGSIFSGGQKQRLSLMRALLSDKKIILLDQPTSSLDWSSEEKVAKVLSRYEGRTRIMITHRNSMNQLVNRTIRLDR